MDDKSDIISYEKSWGAPQSVKLGILLCSNGQKNSTRLVLRPVFLGFGNLHLKVILLPTLLEFSDNAFVQFYISAHNGSHSDVFKVCLTFFGAWLCSRWSLEGSVCLSHTGQFSSLLPPATGEGPLDLQQWQISSNPALQGSSQSFKHFCWDRSEIIVNN